MKTPLPNRPPDGDYTVPQLDINAFQKWLSARTAEDVRTLDQLVYEEGIRRGFGAYWNE